LAAVSVGFLLPVCACVVLIFTSTLSLVSLTALAEGADSGSGAGVGLLDLNGVIFQGDGFGAGSEKLLRDIDWLEKNRDVKAIVVRANSPGGDANASDIIWERLARVQKPVLVSVNGLCASGCYYIAMGADPNEIYATPNSLIGSIGVISQFINIQELADELGVQVEVVATGENKDFGSLFRPLSEEEKAYWREQLAVTLENFLTRVEGGRPNLTRSDIEALANGRVWSASIAQDLGLIDGVLYPQDVYQRAAELGGIRRADFRLIESPYMPDIFGVLESAGLQNGLSLPDANEVLDSLQQAPIQYRYLGPYRGED
jgi:protease-4